MAVDNQNIQDPTTSGLKGLRGLEGINRLRDRGINIDTSILNLANDYRGTTAEIYRTTSPRQNIGFVGIGDSRLDRKITSATQLDNLENTRGELQSGISQISNGLAKGAILAGTTFLDGTIGLLFGAGQAINESRISALWDNDFSKAMQSVNEWAENVLPNYYTDAEKNEPWYEHVFTANFLGDKFIKNLGFTVGAFYSGGVTAAGLKATKLPQIIGAVANSSKAPAIVTSAVGATISAVNEGRIEALNNSTDWFELQKSQLEDKHAARLQMIEQYRGTEMYYSLLAQENANYQSTLEKLTEDRLKMGNADLLMNIPILTASNLVQFGRLYANGYKTARKATNIVGKAGEYATRKNAGIGIAKALFSAVSEGTEELAQKSASVAAGLRYEEDVNNFYKAKIDPDAEQETLNWIKALAKGINQTVNDNSSEEEFFIASLTGALGMPKFRSIKSNEGKFQSPITLDEGFFGKYREYRNHQKREADIATYMNDRVNSPEFINYYQGLIRHNKYQKDMNLAVENGDEFEFKNAEHAQLVSDIAMFDNAGKLEDLVTLINSAFDTSDENLTSIVENTTTTLGDESKVGPFVDKNGNPMYSTPEGKKEMIDKLTQTKSEMLNTITNYTSIKDDIDIRTGQQLSDEQLQELTWLKSQITNWQDRASQLSSEVKPTIRSVAGSLGQLADMYRKIKVDEGKKYAHLTDLYNESDNNERTLRESIDIISTIIGLDDNNFAYLLSSNQEIVDGIKAIINDPISGIVVDDIQKIESKIDDIIKLVNATNNFNTKLKEYLENPKKLQKDIETAVADTSSKESKKRANTLKDSLTSATNLAEFRESLNSEEDDAIKEETLKTLENEGNQLAKDYKEVNNYNKEVQKAINKLDEPHNVKMDAIRLFQEQFNNSNNLSEIANPDSVFIDDEDILHDDTLTDDENIKKFQEAQYALLRAMNKVNNDNKFKDRFSQSYRVLKQKGNPVPNAPEKDTTGDSGTATIPPVNESSLPVITYETSVGNTTATQVSDENKQLNDRVTTQDDLDDKQKGRRPYYRPAIPELHIEASKDGDFRPFDVVVMEREGLNFSEIYNYLRDSGAFKYVNEGNLKVGDELGFMIDPEFENKVAGESWHTKPTIFIIDTRNGQIVGSLDESEYSVDRYEGLKSLEERIIQEFTQVEDKTKRFIATPTTRVSQVMVGRIPYGKDERSLANIPNISSEGRAPIFGIIKNGVLSTNGRLDDGVVIKPVDMAQKEGRMYLLIPNAAGKYSPAAVRVKHFNRSEFNPEDITIQSTTVFNNIQEAINDLANSLSEDDLNNAVRLLKQNIYTGELHIDWFTSDAGNGIRFTKVQRDAQGNEVYEYKNGQRVRKEVVKTVFLTEKWDQNTLFSITGSNDVQTGPASKSIEEVAKEVTNILLDFNLPIQVNLGMLNRGGYNNMFINSGILTSNITDARVVSSWFTTDYFDINGNLQRAVNTASVTPYTRRGSSPVGGNEGVEKGTQITVGNTVYYVDLAQSIITDASGNRRGVAATDGLLVDLAWAQDNFGDTTQSSMMLDNKVWTPSGRVLNRSTQKYLEGEEAQKIIDQLSNTGVPSTTGAFKAIEAEEDIYEYDDEFEEDLDLGSLRRVDIERPTWNQENELAWIKKVLPQLSDNDRVRVVKGLIKVANSGAYAWGQFNDGIITLSDIAAEGTAYHEAFHVVFNLLLDPKEKHLLLDEARKIYGEKDNISLEEDMAEGFREYVMSRDSRGLGRKILDFFKELLAKITNWKYLKPSLYSYYRMINEGKYTKESLRDSNITNLREEEYSQEMQSIKDQAIANNTFMKAPNGKHTNLTERQWLQVRTKAFKEWFGDWENTPNESSKVVDENGEPLVVYHGSQKQFNTFDFREVSNLEGGFYFTSDKKYAENYGTIMYPVFLYIKNPAYNDSINRDVVRDIVITDAQNKYKNSMYNPYDGIIGKDTITGEFKYISKGKEYVIIKSPNQIKSATDNIGTFSGYNNDIRYRKITNTSFETIDSNTKELLMKKGWTREKFDSLSQQERDYATRCASI